MARELGPGGTGRDRARFRRLVSVMRQFRARRPFLAVATGALLLLALPGAVAADSDLERSTPAAGTTVPSPFDGPIVLEFSEPLAQGSKANLVGPGDATVASATVNGPAATMTFSLDAALAAGGYLVKWTSVAEDTHVARETFEFAVAPAVASLSPAPTAEPTSASTGPPAATASLTSAPDATVPAGSEPSASSGPSPAGGDTSGGGADVVLPIVVVLLIVGAGAAHLLTRRNRPPAAR